ncbi:MAG: OsmC family protein [Bacteroidales bacterium]
MKIEISFAGNKKVNANVNGYIVKTDQPLKAGGDGNDPTPFELFFASLGTCAGIFVKTFCDQRKLPTDNIRLVEHIETDPINHTISKIKIEIILPPDFPEKYKNAVINAADLCAVKKLIQNPPKFEIFVTVQPLY